MYEYKHIRVYIFVYINIHIYEYIHTDLYVITTLNYIEYTYFTGRSEATSAGRTQK